MRSRKNKFLLLRSFLINKEERRKEIEALLFFIHNEYWSGPFPSWKGLKTAYPGTSACEQCLASEGALRHCPTSVRSRVWSPRVRSCRNPVSWLLLRHSNPIIHLTEYHINHPTRPRSPVPLLPNVNIFIYCPKPALAAGVYFATTAPFLHSPLPIASDFSGWLLPVRPLFKIPPIKTKSVLSLP